METRRRLQSSEIKGSFLGVSKVGLNKECQQKGKQRKLWSSHSYLRIESARNLLHNLAARPFIFSMTPERKTLARSFYIDSSQNYRQARRVAMERLDTICMKKKHLPSTPETGAFVIQTGFRKAGPRHGRLFQARL